MSELSYCAAHSLLRDGMEFDELCRAAAEAGIVSLELGVGGGLKTPGMEAETLLADARAARRLLATLDAHGLVISALNCVTNPLHPTEAIARENVRALFDTIELAARLGVGRVVTASGCAGVDGVPVWVVWPVFWDELIERSWQEAARVWRRIAARAREMDVELCLELHPGMLVYNVSGFRRLEDAADGALHANLDPSHLFYQGVDPLAVVRELGERVRFVHAKDTVIDEERVAVDGYLDPSPLFSANRAWSYCAVGAGHSLDWWAGFLLALTRAGYTGPISIEHEDERLHGAKAVRANVDALRRAFALADGGA